MNINDKNRTRIMASNLGMEDQQEMKHLDHLPILNGLRRKDRKGNIVEAPPEMMAKLKHHHSHIMEKNARQRLLLVEIELVKNKT